MIEPGRARTLPKAFWFPSSLDGAHDGREITIRAETIAIDHDGIPQVLVSQTD